MKKSINIMLETIIMLYGILGSTASLSNYFKKLKSKLSQIAVHEKTIFDCYQKAIKEVTGTDLSQFRLKGEVAILVDAFNYFQDNDFVAAEGCIAKYFSQNNINYKKITQSFKYHLAESANIQTLMSVVLELFDKVNEIVTDDEKYLFKIVDEQYWQSVKSSIDQNIIDYYTKTNSRIERIQQVVFNDLHVPNDKMEGVFNRYLKEALTNNIALIKILSKGGEGKSTFIHHISRKYYKDYNIVFLEKLGTDALVKLEKKLKQRSNTLPIIFIVDNIAVHSENLVQNISNFISGFNKYKQIFIFAEREFRYINIQSIKEVERLFNEVYQINYKALNLREQIFEKLFSIFEQDNKFSNEIKNNSHKIYLETDETIKRKSISECTYSVLKYLKDTTGFKYKFDWEDWDEFTGDKKYQKLNRLYLILATFYQFGYSLDIDFCADFLPNADSIDINDVLRESPNLPIYMRGNHLFLRHETIADWYLNDTEQATRKNRENSEYVF